MSVSASSSTQAKVFSGVGRVLPFRFTLPCLLEEVHVPS